LLYAAPEIIREVPYDGLKADIWSAGVALYTTIAGHFPWQTDDGLPDEKLIHETAKQILDGNIDMPEEISYQLENMLSNMLDLDPDMRPTAKDLLDHPWFEGEEDVASGISTDPDPALIERVNSLLTALDVRRSGRKISQPY
jgi:serine/threonine protein kinase